MSIDYSDGSMRTVHHHAHRHFRHGRAGGCSVIQD
jgi:hypothetical protein